LIEINDYSHRRRAGRRRRVIAQQIRRRRAHFRKRKSTLPLELFAD
jgi:hypothetical protein